MPKRLTPRGGLFHAQKHAGGVKLHGYYSRRAKNGEVNMADMDKNEQMEQEEEKVTTPASGEGDGGPDNNTPEDDSEPLQLTQKQLDDIIKRAYARGTRKGKRDASKPAAEVTQTEEGPDQEGETAKKAADLLQKATERLLSGTVKGMAADIGLSAKGAKAALKLADFSGCTKDDDVDEESVRDVLEDFLKEYPEFQARESMDSGKPWAMRQGTGQKVSGVEAAFAALNPDIKL